MSSEMSIVNKFKFRLKAFGGPKIEAAETSATIRGEVEDLREAFYFWSSGFSSVFNSTVI